ncbi:MAG: hypothetical protein HOZ81_20285 [Streptomyces sp.]|nr:hypothetical protein [Streptomyces sp.]NUS81880.1 hypothetical protein [Streptomyces sp.]
MTGRRPNRPNGRPAKPNERERLQREALIDALLLRAISGELTIPEASTLAEAWRTERKVEEKTRRRLGETTRALTKHRAAAADIVQELEDRIAELEGQQQEIAA